MCYLWFVAKVFLLPFNILETLNNYLGVAQVQDVWSWSMLNSATVQSKIPAENSGSNGCCDAPYDTAYCMELIQSNIASGVYNSTLARVLGLAKSNISTK